MKGAFGNVIEELFVVQYSVECEWCCRGGDGKLLEKGGVGKLHGSAGWLGGGVLTVHVRGTGLCGVMQRGVVGALACVLFKFYCLRQVHLAEYLPQATHRQNRVKNT